MAVPAKLPATAMMPAGAAAAAAAGAGGGSPGDCCCFGWCCWYRRWVPCHPQFQHLDPLSLDGYPFLNETRPQLGGTDELSG